MFYSQGGIERVIADIIFVDGTGSSVINIESYSVSRVLDKKKKKITVISMFTKKLESQESLNPL